MKINRRISSNIELFEQKINYEFKNKEYILEALTHSSYSNENKNYPFIESFIIFSILVNINSLAHFIPPSR